MNVDYFCLIHEGRCGSTVLASLINQHPEIVHFNEILTKQSWISPEFVGSEWEAKRDALAIHLDNLPDFIRSLAETRKAKGKATCRHIGFEIKLNQLSEAQLACDMPTLVRTLEQTLGNVRFLFLTRRNILRRHVSTLRCLFKEVSHAKDIAAVNFDKVKVDHETMRDWSYDFSKRHASIADLLAASESCRDDVRRFAEQRGDLYLEYEDFERNPLAGAEQIFDALGVPRIAAESPLLKTGDKPLADLIENYDEVRASLAGTRWSGMLD